MLRRICFAFGLLSVIAQAAPLGADHPRLPAFERFFAADSARDTEAGRYLLSELSCVKCHAGGSNSGLSERSAPVLDRVGTRIRIDHLREYLKNPHRIKPGTLMPDLLAGLDEQQRTEHAEALTHFLAGTGTIREVGPNSAAADRGARHYHTLGCVACHGSRKDGAPELATSVPLGKLDEKYTIPSLTEFLKYPHAVRPSGRMPSLNLQDEEARDLANYFLRTIEVPANLSYQVYEGSWDKIPDFASLRPITAGTTTGLDLDVAGRPRNFGIRFEGYLQIEREGNYHFELGSDDGSRLLIDGKTVVDVDGIHPHSVGRKRDHPLAAGPHHVIIDYFQGGGEYSLEARIRGPRTPNQPLEGLLTLTREKPEPRAGFRVDPSLAARGRELFRTIGCANCHQLRENNQVLASALQAKPLAELNTAAGCLTDQPPGTVPRFALHERQSAALSAGLKSLDALAAPEGEAAVFRTMATFNCYACHERNQVGGVEREREAEFLGTTPEMGDEGRIPPSLTGVGDKLNDNWLKHILDNGASDRPYMRTRMPKYGAEHVSGLLQAYPELDRRETSPRAEFALPDYRIKSEGRMLVGDKGLSCVKCHPFGNTQSTGIQALNLQSMTARLREDWFNRYMINPQVYRRGTRMPSAWPNGRTILPDVLAGDTQQQLSAIWLYLADGSQAAIPLGLGGQSIVLEPEQRPIIYRNFIAGHSPRAIAIGYPEQAHLTFDAERFGIRSLWHGAFIDAAKHWVGRGPGNQTPLGDHLVQLVEGIPFAELESLDSAWPEGSPRESGYRFRGYRLNESGQPAFRYSFGEIQINDFPQPRKEGKYANFQRRITLESAEAPPNLYFRAAAGNIKRLSDERFEVDGILKLNVPPTAILREAGGQQQLLIPVSFDGARAEIVVDYLW